LKAFDIKKEVGKVFTLQVAQKRLLVGAISLSSYCFWHICLLFWQLSVLQIDLGAEMLAKSENNQVKVENTPALRGVIFDRNGKQLVENVSSANLYLNIDHYIVDNEIDGASLQSIADTLLGILNTHWKKNSDTEGVEYGSILERILDIHDKSPYLLTY
jgi:cell division protein FtsI/penicillin-binding protein 2